MIRGPYNNKKEEYDKAIELRKEGYGYITIAKRINYAVSYHTIRHWCSEIKIPGKTSAQLGYTERLLPIMKLKNNSQVRARLIDERGNKCESCGIDGWQGKKITVELHHIDGDKKNNNPENLELLCPNCHSQTDNYKNNKRV